MGFIDSVAETALCNALGGLLWLGQLFTVSLSFLLDSALASVSRMVRVSGSASFYEARVRPHSVSI